MPYDSILEIPKAAASDENTAKDPYVAESYEAPRVSCQRRTGTPEFVAKARVTDCSSPDFTENGPGRLNESEPDNDTATPDAAARAASTSYRLAGSRA